MAQFYDDISNLEDPHIRLLTLEPHSDPAAPVICTLETHRVTELPHYEALSYVWGDASIREDITVNNVTMSVTHNLYSALRMLRSPELHLVIWVDAICINQDDLDERSAQVQLMGDIYRKADVTMIWLGFEDQASETVMEICREVGLALSEEDRAMPPIVDNKEYIAALLEFFDRPWWMRSWVIQELCLAKDAFLVVGNMALPWQCFAAMLHHIGDEITEKRDDALNAMLVLVRSEGFVAARGLKNKRREMESEDNKITLLDVLVEFRNSATTDRRDKVYALLGLVTEPETAVRPDYTATANQAYIQTAKAILESTRDLTLLESLSMFERFRDPGLPSWVPQWDGESNKENPGEKVPSHVRSVAHTTRRKLASIKRPPINASKSYQVTRLEYEEQNVLVLDGYVWDEITTLGEPLNFPTKIHEDMSQESWKAPGGNLMTFLLSGMELSGHIRDAMRSWHKLALNKRPYPSGQDRKEAFITTIYGPGADIDESTANYDLAWSTFVTQQQGLSWGVSSMLGLVSKSSKLTFDGLLSLRKTTRENAFGCLPNCYDKRVAITGKDYIALVPKSAAKGDKIALMPGGDKPFLLRPDGTRFTVVGACHVQGVMSGEVWDPKKMHPMRFA